MSDRERARDLARRLGLAPHPEGGAFRRIHTSARTVASQGMAGPRPALTVITYLLGPGEASRWHRVAQDEAWHLLEGRLELL